MRPVVTDIYYSRERAAALLASAAIPTAFLAGRGEARCGPSVFQSGGMKMKNAVVATLISGLLVSLRTSNAFAADGSVLVEMEDGKLVYHATENGDTIPDFSFCGYRGGGVSIPDIKVMMVVGPGRGSGDDTERIQAALDKVGRMRQGRYGFRGTLLLRAGT